MGRKPKIQTRVEHDTKDAIDAYTDDHDDLSQSEAVRHLLRAGLAEKGYPVAVTDGGPSRYIDDTLLKRLANARTMTAAALVGLLAVGFFGLAALFADASLAAALGALVGGIVLLAITAVITTITALAQLALARPLRELTPFTKESETA